MFKKFLILPGLIFVFLTGGCSTPKAKVDSSGPLKQELAGKIIPAVSPVQPEPSIEPKQEALAEPAPAGRFWNEVKIFNDIQQVDLDNDGAKEIVAVYTSMQNVKAVKVFKSSSGKNNVVFEEAFPGREVIFDANKSAPMIIVKNNLSGGGVEKVYRWNGSTFVFADHKQ